MTAPIAVAVHQMRRATRRACVALVTLAAMLHLTLAGGDMACLSHDAPASARGMAMEGGASHASHAAASMTLAPAADAQAGAQPADHCATPVQAGCCESAASCGVAATVSELARASAGRVPASATPSVPSAVLVSVLTTPEPPPPKA